MQTELASAEKKSTSMDGLLMEIQSEIESFKKMNDRLRRLANNVEADPPKESAPTPKEAPRFSEGILYGINTYLLEMKDRNREYDYLLTRLEKMI